MAKRRVYELARELNMTNKELLDKLQELEIEVSSHMSSLEDEDITTIKNSVYGKKEEAAKIEEQRIRPNIIRRRRKPVPEEEIRAEAIDEMEQAEEAAPPTAEPIPEAEAEVSEEPRPTMEPEPVAPVETIQAAAPERVEIPAETPAAATEDVEPPSPIVETAPVEEAETGTDQTPELPEAEETVGPEGEIKAEEKPEKGKKPKKKLKKSTPAKIISLPEETEPVPAPAVPEPAVRVVTRARPKPAGGAPTPEARRVAPVVEVKPEADDKKKRGKKKVVPEPEVEDKLDKGKKVKKGSFKRKEVVVGDALHDQRFGRTRKGQKKGKAAKVEFKPQITIPKAIKRRIKVDETIVLGDLAKRLGVKASELIKKLMNMGVMVTVNQTVDFDTASLLATEFNFETERAAFEEESFIQAAEDAPEQMQFRPPVVTIMGHVDHGKTSLLDAIRHSKITDKEAGGITQHIGAYHVNVPKGDIIFLDTPGHEAFTAMRARGAQVTDIVILVVAADDGVMPQTIEAIDHSRAAGVPIIVAINKIDKPGADPERIKRELADRNLVPEDWGGDTIFVNVSAKENVGLDELLEMILLQAEVLELKANPDKLARGYIIESRLESGRGPVATILIHEGTLRTGEAVVSGMYYGKIRAMFDDRGNPIKEIGPSFPVEIIGLSGVPMAGEELIAVTDEKNAKQVSEHRLQKQRSEDLASTTRMSLEKLYEQMQEGEVKDLNLILKADFQGSIEALRDSLTRLSTGEVKINIIHSATGTVHESDISLAAVSNAIILGFNVRPTGKVAQMAEEEHVDIRYYNVIYNAIKEIKDAMVGLMASRFEERVLGRAEVRLVFNVPSAGTVGGCMVIDGKIQRNQLIRLVRDGIVIHEGKIASLRRFKDDVREVLQNYECGIGIERFNDIKVGDIIECYYLEEIKPVME